MITHFERMTEAQKEHFRKDWNATTITRLQMADAMGVNPETVKRIASQLGLGKKATPQREWTDELRDEARRLWLAGYSAMQIANQVNRQHRTRFTRNATISVLRRMKLLGERPTVSTPRPPAARRANGGAGQLAQAKARSAAMRAPEVKPANPAARNALGAKAAMTPVALKDRAQLRLVVAPAPRSESEALPGAGEPIPFLERQFGQCSWIVSGDADEVMVCGAAIHKRSWCAHHYAVGTVPTGKPSELIRSLRRYAA